MGWKLGKDLKAPLPQLLLIGMEGTSPSRRLKRLIRRGLGGIIFYERNFEDAHGLRALIRAVSYTHLTLPTKA